MFRVFFAIMIFHWGWHSQGNFEVQQEKRGIDLKQFCSTYSLLNLLFLVLLIFLRSQSKTLYVRHDSSHCDYRLLWIAEQSGTVNKRGSLVGVNSFYSFRAQSILIENKWQQYWRMMVILTTGIKRMREMRRANMDRRKRGVTLQIGGENMRPEHQYVARSRAVQHPCLFSFWATEQT